MLTAVQNLNYQSLNGVQKCEYCTLEQIILEQVKIDLDREKANEEETDVQKAIRKIKEEGYYDLEGMR